VLFNHLIKGEKMAQDPRTKPVTARILFKGVMLVCITDSNRCEVGFIQCPAHTPTLTIKTTDAGGTTESPLNWAPGHDLIFRVTNPETPGITMLRSGGDTDFGWVPDLEGAKLHNGPVSVNKGLLNGRRLGITAGELYTHELTGGEYDLIKWSAANPTGQNLGNFGRLAKLGGLNIVCLDGTGSGITILDNVTGQTLVSLAKLAGTSYQVCVDNDCGEDAAPPPVGTDFRVYYDVVSAPGGNRFDFKAPVIPAPGPDICEYAFLGIAKTLGLAWRP
jgi:hypothetical protein